MRFIRNIFLKNKKVCGLEINKYSLKIFLCTLKNGNIASMRFGNYKLSPGLLENGLVKNKEKFIELLVHIKKLYKLGNNPVIARINSNKVITRYIEFPSVSIKNLKSVVLLEAQRIFPYTLENAVFDYIRLGPSKVNNTFKMEGVLLGALPKNIIYDYYSSLKNAGFNLIAVDVASLALRRWLLKCGRFSFPDALFTNLCIINLEKEITDIVIMKKGIPIFTRSLNIDDYKEQLIMKDLVRDVADSLEYCKDDLMLPNISKIIFTGSLSEEIDIKETFSKSFLQPIEVGNIELKDINSHIPAGFAMTSGLVLRNV